MSKIEWERFDREICQIREREMERDWAGGKKDIERPTSKGWRCTKSPMTKENAISNASRAVWALSFGYSLRFGPWTLGVSTGQGLNDE